MPSSAAPAAAAAPADGFREAIEAALLDTPPAARTATHEQLSRLYLTRGFQPAWLDPAGRPNALGRQALSVLADSVRHGLDPAGYDTRGLSELAATLDGQPPGIAASRLAAFELRMSAAMLRYLRHLHVGRVDPAAVRFAIPSRALEHNYAAVLQAAISGGHLRQAAEDLAPSFAQYAALRGALERYRVIASESTATVLPATARGIKPGEPYLQAETLSRHLVALGDLPPGDAVGPDAPQVLTPALSAGLKRFQARHGLADDGVLGKATVAALNVPLAWRLRQIELAMERLRWLPHRDGRPFVAINIPAFRLWARDAGASAGTSVGPSVDMAVIVGRALNTQTPVFIDEMTHLIFRPYWNIPPSIVRNEILPALGRDPAYLQRHDMEIVQGTGDDARSVAPTAGNIALLRQGALRLRQRPGPANSLGLVKFVFPNDANVYMHDTPARQLFARSRRDFSHGCIRLEDPVALAQWALRDQPEWTRERIVAAMQGPKSVRVNLSRPVRVVLFYITATVNPRSGEIHFSEDIYGHDAVLDRALAPRAAPVALPGAHAAGVDVDEVGVGVVAHAPAAQ